MNQETWGGQFLSPLIGDSRNGNNEHNTDKRLRRVSFTEFSFPYPNKLICVITDYENDRVFEITTESQKQKDVLLMGLKKLQRGDILYVDDNHSDDVPYPYPRHIRQILSEDGKCIFNNPHIENIVNGRRMPMF